MKERKRQLIKAEIPPELNILYRYLEDPGLTIISDLKQITVYQLYRCLQQVLEEAFSPHNSAGAFNIPVRFDTIHGNHALSSVSISVRYPTRILSAPQQALLKANSSTAYKASGSLAEIHIDAHVYAYHPALGSPLKHIESLDFRDFGPNSPSSAIKYMAKPTCIQNDTSPTAITGSFPSPEPANSCFQDYNMKIMTYDEDRPTVEGAFDIPDIEYLDQMMITRQCGLLFKEVYAATMALVNDLRLATPWIPANFEKIQRGYLGSVKAVDSINENDFTEAAQRYVKNPYKYFLSVL